MTKVGVVLAGSGVKDGSEIHEAVLTLLYLDQSGVETVCMAPDIEQTKVTNHLTGETVNEKRNVLIESARIARGNIKNIKDVDIRSLDAIIFPGGFGAALNLSKFGIEGVNCYVNPDVEILIKEAYSLKKVLGFICISPASLAARVLGGNKVKVTIGTDPSTALAVNKMGAIHQDCKVDDIIVDLENKIVTTPAYMLGESIKDIAKGIEKLVKEVVKLSSI